MSRGSARSSLPKTIAQEIVVEVLEVNSERMDAPLTNRPLLHLQHVPPPASGSRLAGETRLSRVAAPARATARASGREADFRVFSPLKMEGLICEP